MSSRLSRHRRQSRVFFHRLLGALRVSPQRWVHHAAGSLKNSTRPRSGHDLPSGSMGRRVIGNKHSTEIGRARMTHL
jgi:hypothetical protein